MFQGNIYYAVNATAEPRISAQTLPFRQLARITDPLIVTSAPAAVATFPFCRSSDLTSAVRFFSSGVIPYGPA
jgi:hypothetical protein